MRSAARLKARACAVLAAACAGSLLTPAMGNAVAPTFDPGFGNCGRVTVDVVDDTDQAVTAAVTSDGMYLVGGYTVLEPGTASQLVARFFPDGSIDQAFGYYGISVHAEGTVTDLVALPDGSTLMGSDRGAVTKLDPDGYLDDTFGNFGVAGVGDSIGRIVPEASGSFLVMTQSSVARLTTGGTVTTLTSSLPPLGDVLPLSDGGFLVLRRDFRVSRHSSSGALDGTFGTAGVSPAVSLAETDATALRLDGSAILAGGYSGWSAALVRWTATGALDPTFDGDGMKTAGLFSSGPGQKERSTFDSAGRLLLTGFRNQPDPGAFVVRLTAGGSLDPSWGSGGIYRRWSGLSELLGPPVDLEPGGYLLPYSTWGTSGAHSLDFGLTVVGGSGTPPKGYIVDGWGGIHGYGACGLAPAPTPTDGPYWRGWDIVRGITTTAGGGGLIVDGWGGLHPYQTGGGKPASPQNGPYWQGWDIVRGVTASGYDKTGYIVDGWGGLHPFSWDGQPKPTRPTDGPYWEGWDIVRGVALLPDGTGGYVLDGWGGLHPFSVDGWDPPPPAVGNAYWEGWDIARGVTILPNGSGGYVVDGWGGLHPFAIGFNSQPPTTNSGPYWSGWDITSGVTATPPA